MTIKSITPKGDSSWYIKWISSLNIYPINLFFHLVGVAGWFVVGMLWHDRSLILLNAIAVVIFILGIGNYYLGPEIIMLP